MLDRYQQSQHPSAKTLLLPTYEREELLVGSQVGRGGFSDVFVVRLKAKVSGEEKEDDAEHVVTIKHCRAISSHSTTMMTGEWSRCPPPRALSSLSSLEEDSSADRPFPASFCCTSRLVLKQVRQDLIGTSQGTDAAQDMRTEVRLLSDLPRHANIIRLVAISQDFGQQQQEVGKDYMILERVSETLDQRLHRWAIRERLRAKNGGGSCSSMVTHWLPGRKSTTDHIREERQRKRIQTSAAGVARALAFLHQHKIMFRDVKPQNVGFGFDDQVKLFDFGLARKINSNGQPQLMEDGSDNCAGTVRYMAPEVAQHGESTLAADVYSLSHLVWEVATLQKPYSTMTSAEQLRRFTCNRQGRPLVKKIVSPTLRALLTEGWHPDRCERPSMEMFCQRLEQECGLVGEHIPPKAYGCHDDEQVFQFSSNIQTLQ